MITKYFMAKAWLLTTMMIIANYTNGQISVASITNKAFELHRMTAVVWWRCDPNIVTRVLKQLRGTVVVAPIPQTTQEIRFTYTKLRYRQLLFIAATAEEFQYYLSVIHKDVIIPFRTILFLSNPISNRSELTLALKAAWNYDVGNIIVLRKNLGNDTVKLFTYFPYQDGKCGDYNPVALDISNGNYFPRKFGNFHQCSIKLSVSQASPQVVITTKENVNSVTGEEVMLTELVIVALKATPEYVTLDPASNVGDVAANGSATGTFRDLVERRADIILPARLMTLNRYAVSQESPALYIDKIIWLAPARREIYAWLKVLLPFCSNISPFLVMSFVVFLIVTMMVQKYSIRQPVKSGNVTYQMFAIFLDQTVKINTICWLVNSLFVLWIWFCLLIRIAYQGDLVTRLNTIILEPPLQTLEEAMANVDGFGGPAVLRHLYDDQPVIWKRYEMINNEQIRDYLYEIYVGKRFLLINAEDDYWVQYYLRFLQKLDLTVNMAVSYVYLRPGWPAAGEVKHAIGLIIESGIWNQLRVESHEKLKRTFPPPIVVEKTNPLIVSFYGLLAVDSMCVIVLFIEILYHRFKNRTRSRHVYIS